MLLCLSDLLLLAISVDDFCSSFGMSAIRYQVAREGGRGDRRHIPKVSGGTFLASTSHSEVKSEIMNHPLTGGRDHTEGFGRTVMATALENYKGLLSLSLSVTYSVSLFSLDICTELGHTVAAALQSENSTNIRKTSALEFYQAATSQFHCWDCWIECSYHY